MEAFHGLPPRTPQCRIHTPSIGPCRQEKFEMKNVVKTVVSVTTALLLAAACAGTSKTKGPRYDCYGKVAQAVKKYQEGHYSSAKALLDDVKLQCSGHDVMDTAEYYLAQSLLRMKEYSDAKIEFMRLVQDFPRGPFNDEAQFRIGYCVFKSARDVDRDQAESGEALKILHDYLDANPSGPFADSAQKYLILISDKLAEKDFNTAKFYQKIGEKEAAVVSYKSFVNDFPGSKFTAQARLNMGQLLIDLGRKAEAKETLEALIEKEQKGDYVQKARELLAHLGS
jgi:outer membrane protein assembly factor BamD